MTINVTVKPNSKAGDNVAQISATEYVVYLRARAIENAANTALIELLSAHFHVPKTTIKILRGQKSRMKVVGIPELAN
jgi:uncharacterized protein YggU (UPF0235/DUF167 family)